MDTSNLKDNLSRLEENFDKLANITKAKFTKALNREDTVLLVIDIQEKLAPAMKNKDLTINNTKVLLKMAEVMGMEVIVTEQYPRGLGSSLEVISENFTDKTKVFDKLTFSAIKTDEIREYIEKLNKPNFIVLGMESHICVYQTAKDLLIKGYNVFIPKDAVDSRTDENLENGLELMRDYGAKISNTETILFELLGRAGTEEFKVLSPLIK